MRHIIGMLIRTFAYYCAIDELFYFLNRRAKRVLVFHNVLPDDLFRPGVANGVSMRLSEFSKVIDECAKHFGFTADVMDGKGATITFDDGFRNQYTTAFHLLRRRGIAACIFVTEHSMTKSRILVIDLLMHWVDNVPLDCIPGADRLRYWNEHVWPAFVKDAKCFGETILKELDKRFPMDAVLAHLPDRYREERLGPISEKELGEMRMAGWRIGWHTRNHVVLSSLPESMIRNELDCPPQYRNECLSFPYGHMNLVGVDAIRLARIMGFPCAVSNVWGARENASQYFLPRMALPTSKIELHYVLSGFEYFLKHFRLLPKWRSG